VKVSASIVVPGRISDAEAIWFDVRRWPTWVDGYGHLAKAEGAWPEVGAQVQWNSPPAGRGRVVERVLRHDPRVEQVVEVEDGKIRGRQTVAFEAVGTEETRVILSLDYELKERNALTPLVDVLFVSRAMRDSIKRTLAKFANECRADGELP
jgi:hypothetical protein